MDSKENTTLFFTLSIPPPHGTQAIERACGQHAVAKMKLFATILALEGCVDPAYPNPSPSPTPYPDPDPDPDPNPNPNPNP